MTLVTKNGSLIVKDGKAAENCGCCGDWWCDLDPAFNPSTPCGSLQAISMSIDIAASPALNDPRFGVEPANALKARFPAGVSKTITLQKSGGSFSFSGGFNSFGVGEFASRAVVAEGPSGVCSRSLEITTLYFLWKWDLLAGDFSPGDDAREPEGFNYANLIFQWAQVLIRRNVMRVTYPVGHDPCFPPTTFSASTAAQPGWGTASGTISLSPA